MSAIRKWAEEAADNGLIAPELAAEAHVTALANEVGDYPMFFPLLYPFDCETGYFRPPESAA